MAFMSRALKPTKQRYSAYEEGDGGGCILLHPVAALFGGLSRQSHGDYRSSAPDPPDGTASLVPDTVEVGTTGVVSINQSIPSSSTNRARQTLSPMH